MKRNASPFRWLTYNWGWKLASVLLAALLWFLVTNYNDPVISVPFYNIPVTLRNTNVITDAGQVYEILENTDTVATVTITANRSIAESFTRDNILAIADMNEITSRDTVPIHFSVNKNASDITRITGSIEDVRLNIEDRKTRTIALNVTTSGELAEGYTVGSVTPAQNLVRISGPASRVDMIDSAVADVDVTGFTSDIGTEADIRLFDAQGVLVRDTAITQNISTVRIQISILQIRTVPVRVRITGTPEQGYLVAGEAQIAPQALNIAGTAEELAQAGEIVIEGDAVDITGRTEDLVTEVRIADYLPAGVIITGDVTDPVANITVSIREEVTSVLEVPYTRVAVENVPEGMTCTVAEEAETFEVTIAGLEEAVGALTPQDVLFALDVGAAIDAGTEQMPERLTILAQLRQPEGARIVGSVPVHVDLR